MEYSKVEKENTVVFQFKGNLMGGPASNAFRDEVKALLDQDKTNLIGDFGEVNFMNSSGLGVLIATLTTTRKAGGDFKLCNSSDRIKSLLKVSKLFSVFDHYETLDKAVEAYSE